MQKSNCAAPQYKPTIEKFGTSIHNCVACTFRCQKMVKSTRILSGEKPLPQNNSNQPQADFTVYTNLKG